MTMLVCTLTKAPHKAKQRLRESEKTIKMENKEETKAIKKKINDK